MPRHFIDTKATKSLYDENNYSKSVLDNGLTVISQHMPNLRSISIGVWVLTGSRYEQASNMGICHFIEHSVFKGTKKRNALQIAKSLENVGGTLNAFTSKEHTCYYANILSEDLPLAVDVLSDLVKQARFVEKEIAREKQVILEELKDTEDTPEEFIQDHFYGQVYHNHPLGFNILGSKETITAFTRKEIFDFYSKYYVPSNMIVSAAGNFDPRQLEKLIASKFRFHHNGTQRAYWPNGFKRYPVSRTPGRTVTLEKDISQSHICMGLAIDMAYTNEKRFHHLVINTILGGGMSSRLFQKIREKMGLAYSIYSFVDFLYDCGIFGVYWATDKNKQARSIDVVKREIENLATHPIRPSEIRMAKAQIKANLLFGLESTSTRMIRLAKNEIYLKKKVNIADVTKLIEKLSIKDIQKTANELASQTGRFQISILN